MTYFIKKTKQHILVKIIWINWFIRDSGLESALISTFFFFFLEKTGMVLRNWKQQG
jgi:hypothetical protein